MTASALRGHRSACTLQSNVESESAITDLRARVAAMRELGVVKWADIELGPLPTSPVGDGEDETQRSDRLELVKREREQRLRFGASGGPRPRVDHR